MNTGVLHHDERVRHGCRRVFFYKSKCVPVLFFYRVAICNAVDFFLVSESSVWSLFIRVAMWRALLFCIEHCVTVKAKIVKKYLNNMS